MVSITGTQHRHAQAAASKQTQGGDDAVVRGKSAMSVGHLAKAQLAQQSSDGEAAPNALGKAAAVIAKMTLDQRAELLETLQNPGTGDTTDPTVPSDPTDGAGTTDPTTGGETTPPVEAGSEDQTPPVQSDPVTDEPTTAPDTTGDNTETTAGDAAPGTPSTPPAADAPADAAAVALLDQILAAAEENSQPV